MEIEFIDDNNFSKNLKKYYKKYLSIYNDLEIFKQVLKDRYKSENINNIISKHTNILIEQDNIYIIKDRLMSKSLKGSSMRIIHIYQKSCNKVIFLELYYKGDKENENRELYQNKLKEILKKN